MPKAAIVVLADTETKEGLGRVANALTSAKEFKEEDHGVAINQKCFWAIDRGPL